MSIERALSKVGGNTYLRMATSGSVKCLVSAYGLGPVEVGVNARIKLVHPIGLVWACGVGSWPGSCGVCSAWVVKSSCASVVVGPGGGGGVLSWGGGESVVCRGSSAVVYIITHVLCSVAVSVDARISSPGVSAMSADASKTGTCGGRIMMSRIQASGVLSASGRTARETTRGECTSAGGTVGTIGVRVHTSYFKS